MIRVNRKAVEEAAQFLKNNPTSTDVHFHENEYTDVSDRIPKQEVKFETRKEVYSRERLLMMNYLQLKFDDRDWHAVSDAANDLRVLEASKR